MTLNDAVGILKAINEIIKGNQRVCFDEQDIEAIDTVVKELEKPLPTDEEIVNEANEIGEKEYWPIGRQTGFVFGAKWMRDLIQERSKK